jgi:membrane associated rhomboid family serine protease
MSYSYRPRFGFGSTLTPMVKSLLIINVIVFLLEYITGGTEMIYLLGLVPRFVLRRFFIWQFFTYMFLHGGFWHLFLNMFILWMFGSEIERYWGSREFLKYYFITGIGAGVLSWLTAMNSPIPTIGASGAIYGILVAYGMMFPNRPVYLYFLLPVKAKHFVIFLAIMELFASRAHASSGIAHFAHLGGMLFGYLYLKRERFSYLLGDILRGSKSKREAQKRLREQEEREMERKVDEILQKISREGRDSLTKEEKELLEWASKRYRQH